LLLPQGAVSANQLAVLRNFSDRYGVHQLEIETADQAPVADAQPRPSGQQARPLRQQGGWMARINNKTSQTLSIGRAVIAIVVLLGIFQIGWVTRLLAASWQHYQQAVELAEVHQISSKFYTAADLLRREAILGRGLLYRNTPPYPSERSALALLRMQADSWMAQALAAGERDIA
jgi:hypothetical protein